MTREEAIIQLEYRKDFATKDQIEAIDMAIDSLSQEPCEDAISRQATVERLCKVAEFMNEKRKGLGSPYVMAALFIQDNKDEFPSVTPIRPKEKWLLQQEENGDDYFEAWDISGVHTYAARYKCSKCGFIHNCIEDHGHYHFCPNCGEDMRGTSDE